MADLSIIGLAVAAVPGVWMLLVLTNLGPLRALWREPVFREPVAILESDDWGAGPAEQAAALEELRVLLCGVRNARGEAPVMTLGVILETVDRDALRTSGEHVAVALDDPRHAAVLAALRAGESAGVFALQLHGLCHYWPPSLLARAARDPGVADWLSGAGLGWTEDLPSALQSRWTDTATLPSRALPEHTVVEAARTEVATWLRVFGTPPVVAVPTTFVWTPAVERAWATAGVRVLVTPGGRREGRDARGMPAPVVTRIRNGERGAGGLLLLVRDVYFEPVFGHAPSRLADGVSARAALGRPALIEMHRFNFCGPRGTRQACATLRDGLLQLISRVPAVRFLSTASLADIIARRDPAWIERSRRRRLADWAGRVLGLSPFARVARLTGFVVPLKMMQALA